MKGREAVREKRRAARRQGYRATKSESRDEATTRTVTR